jgi:hypothetical protein
MTPDAYRDFTDQLLSRLSSEREVVGLVTLGSTSGLPPAPDAFSDHDFFVVTVAGAQERFRSDLGWLPDASNVALAFQESAHGVKALYASGHVADFSVFDLDELAEARVNRLRVLLDRGDVAARLERVRAITAATANMERPDESWQAGRFLTSLVAGAGRAARGEGLSGHQLVRGDAIAHLVPLLRARVDVEHVGSLDFLDPFRRLEQALPKVCDELERAARLPVIPAARALLELGARELPDLVGPAARAAVEKVLGEAEAAAAEHARH